MVADEFREVVRQGYHRNVTAFPDYFVEIHDMIAEGEQVVVEWTHRGVHRGLYDGIPATGKTITGKAISIYRVIDGQITDARGIWDRGEIWQQLGLIPDTEDDTQCSRHQVDGQAIRSPLENQAAVPSAGRRRARLWRMHQARPARGRRKCLTKPQATFMESKNP